MMGIRRSRSIKKMILILIILVLVLSISAFAILYFATDVFKNNKSLFKKYASQVDLNSFFNLNDSAEYIKRLKEDANTKEGNITITLSQKDQKDASIDEQIEYVLKSNPNQKKSNGRFKYIQDDGKSIDINYIKNDDLYGIQFDGIVNQYLAFENNNIKDFVEKLELQNTEAIPDKIEILNNQNFTFDENAKELKQLINKYLNIAEKQIPEESYTKIKNEQITIEGKTIEAEGFNVSITGEQLINILNEYVDNIKEDKQLYEYISSMNLIEDITFEDYQATAEELYALIEDIKNEMQVQLNISVYKQGNKFIKLYGKLDNSQGEGKSYIEFAIENNNTIELNCLLNTENITANPINMELNITIAKNTSNGQEEGLSIAIEAKQNNEELLKTNLEYSRYGKTDAQNVKTEIMQTVEVDGLKLKIGLNNSTEFGLDESLEDLDKDNRIIINELEKEKINNLIRNLSRLVFEKIDAQKSILGSYIMAYEQTLEAAQNEAEAVKKASVKEAIAVTQANIIADYYGEEITDVAIDLIKQEMQKNLQGEELEGAQIKVTKLTEIGKFKIEIEGVELEEEASILDLSVMFTE